MPDFRNRCSLPGVSQHCLKSKTVIEPEGGPPGRPLTHRLPVVPPRLHKRPAHPGPAGRRPTTRTPAGRWPRRAAGAHHRRLGWTLTISDNSSSSESPTLSRVPRPSEPAHSPLWKWTARTAYQEPAVMGRADVRQRRKDSPHPAVSQVLASVFSIQSRSLRGGQLLPNSLWPRLRQREGS